VEKKAFLLRISPELWAELNRWAGDELRSVNGQIEYVLKRAVEERKGKRRSEKTEEHGGRGQK
jgi:hypothetical protein